MPMLTLSPVRLRDGCLAAGVEALCDPVQILPDRLPEMLERMNAWALRHASAAMPALGIIAASDGQTLTGEAALTVRTCSPQTEEDELLRRLEDLYDAVLGEDPSFKRTETEGLARWFPAREERWKVLHRPSGPSGDGGVCFDDAVKDSFDLQRLSLPAGCGILLTLLPGPGTDPVRKHDESGSAGTAWGCTCLVWTGENADLRTVSAALERAGLDVRAASSGIDGCRTMYEALLDPRTLRLRLAERAGSVRLGSLRASISLRELMRLAGRRGDNG